MSKIVSADDCAIGTGVYTATGTCMGDSDEVPDDTLFVVSYAFAI